jgi:hypothetical protein
MVRSVASRFATRDLGSAMRLVESLPLGMRSAWIAEVAGSYASRDPRAALDWIEQYRGPPFYDDARSQVVVRVADTNPQLAATMLDGLDPTLRAVAAPRIAAAMSARDPQAAAEWVVGLEDRTLASEAASEVVRAWVRRDVEGVRRWVLGLERGEFRDDALATLAGATYGTGLDPLPLLAEIESKEALDRGRYFAVFTLLSSRPEAAQELLEALLDHPVYGAWARDTLRRSTDP